MTNFVAKTLTGLGFLASRANSAPVPECDSPLPEHCGKPSQTTNPHDPMRRDGNHQRSLQSETCTLSPDHPDSQKTEIPSPAVNSYVRDLGSFGQGAKLENVTADTGFFLIDSEGQNIGFDCSRLLLLRGSTLNFTDPNATQGQNSVSDFPQDVLAIGTNIISPENRAAFNAALNLALTGCEPLSENSGVTVRQEGADTNVQIGKTLGVVENERGGRTIISGLLQNCTFSEAPSTSPSLKPSESNSPSFQPTPKTTDQPSVSPTAAPSVKPSFNPTTGVTTLVPSTEPSVADSHVPSYRPSVNPTTGATTLVPSEGPSAQPTYILVSDSPSGKPTFIPTYQPSGEPSFDPSNPPSQVVTFDPSGKPSVLPSVSISTPPTVKEDETAVPSLRPTKESNSPVEASETPTSKPQEAASSGTKANAEVALGVAGAAAFFGYVADELNNIWN